MRIMTRENANLPEGDLTDAQWSLIEPYLPISYGGRPRKTALRDVVEAIVYILLHRLPVAAHLPQGLPRPRAPSGDTSTSGDTMARSTPSTTYSAKVRTAQKPYAPALHGQRRQSVGRYHLGWRATRGRDNAKNVDGRKRHIVVDSMGLLLAVLVTLAANCG